MTALGLDTTQQIEAFAREARALALIAMTADPDLAVPSCPEWVLRDLFRHVGGIHRWIDALVTDRVAVARWRNSYDIAYPDDTDDWGPFLADIVEPLSATLAAVPPHVRMWGWGVDPHARFWIRRALFETVAHRADAELALGLDPVVDPVLAVEGIDEFLENLPATARWGSPISDLRGKGEVIELSATDTGEVWSIELTPHGWWWQRGGLTPLATVAGTASALWLSLQGRPAEVDETGDTHLVDVWRAATPF